MTQPRYAPITDDDKVRPVDRLEPPRRWTATRPGELAPGRSFLGAATGRPGPDQGYALRLVSAFVPSLVLSPGEREEDVISGTVALAMRRAASFGRAPIRADLEAALRLFGFLSAAPDDLVEYRRRLFRGMAHDEWRRQVVSNSVPLSALRRPPGEIVPDLALVQHEELRTQEIGEGKIAGSGPPTGGH